MMSPLPTRPWLRRLAGGCLSTLLLGLTLLVAALLITRFVCLSLRESPPSPAQEKQEAALALRLQQDVEHLCAHPRFGSEQDRRRAADYIVQRLEAAGWQVRRAAFIVPADPEAAEDEAEDNAEGAESATEGMPDAAPQETHWNIIATHPQHTSGQRYIIGAHYDACNTGDSNPGADDNASACAALLALADLLSPRKTGSMPPGAPSLELVFYACEEPPWFDTEWMGSAVHARHCTPRETLGMVCLEMLGYYSEAPCAHPELLPGHKLLLPEKGDFIAIVGDTHALPLARRAHEHLQRGMPALRVNIPFTQETELFFSDHRNYASRSIPSIMVTDTALLRNPNYHEATDTPDTLDYPRMARVTLNLARFLRALIREPNQQAPAKTAQKQANLGAVPNLQAE